MGATAAMATLQVGSSALAADGQRAQGRFSKRMNEINAIRSDMQADDTIKRGNESADAYAKKVSSLAGSQKAALAAQGIDIGYGSASDVISQTFELGAEDTQKIRSNAFREALGYKTQAQDMRAQGQLAQVAGNTSATMTLLNGGMSALGTGYKNGVFDGGGQSYTPRTKSKPTSEVV